jgi:hypothetical protein
VQIEVAENPVEISWDERETLLERLHDVAGSETIIERFWAVGASLPVVLDDGQQAQLLVALDRWSAGELPDGIARLREALERAAPAGDEDSSGRPLCACPGGEQTGEDV